MLVEHPKLVVTKAVLVAADERHHGYIIRLLIEKQPRVLQNLFEWPTPCMPSDELEHKLLQREKASALTFLMAGERRFVHVSNVLREVIVVYACYDLSENAADNSKYPSR
jgi:hypothetical protein